MKESVKVFYHTYVWTVGRLQTLVNNRVSHIYVLFGLCTTPVTPRYAYQCQLCTIVRCSPSLHHRAPRKVLDDFFIGLICCIPLLYKVVVSVSSICFEILTFAVVWCLPQFIPLLYMMAVTLSTTCQEIVTFTFAYGGVTIVDSTCVLIQPSSTSVLPPLQIVTIVHQYYSTLVLPVTSTLVLFLNHKQTLLVIYLI